MENIGILKINEMAEKTPGCIRFDKGSAKFPFPGEFLASLSGLKDDFQGKYFHYPKTGGEIFLKEEIVEFEKGNGRELSIENICVTHGGMSGIFAFLTLYAKPGDEILTNVRSFEGFGSIISQFGIKQIRVDFTSIESVSSAISKKTKAIFYNSPENPTGKVYSKVELADLLQIARKNDLFFVSDEVMSRVTYGGQIWQGPDVSDKHIIISSFSKMFFIPGSRLGWIAASKEIAENFANYFSVSSIGVNLFSQYFLARVLKTTNFEKLLKERMLVLEGRKRLMGSTLDKFGVAYFQHPQGGMNYYVDLRKNSISQCQKLLAEASIALIPGALFEGRETTFARMGFGAVDDSEITRGVELLARNI